MSQTPDSAVRTYIEQHRAAFLDDLAERLRIPSVSAQPDHAPDVRRSADRLAARLKKAGFPTAAARETPGAPAVHPRLLASDSMWSEGIVVMRPDRPASSGSAWRAGHTGKAVPYRQAPPPDPVASRRLSH